MEENQKRRGIVPRSKNATLGSCVGQRSEQMGMIRTMRSTRFGTRRLTSWAKDEDAHRVPHG